MVSELCSTNQNGVSFLGAAASVGKEITTPLSQNALLSSRCEQKHEIDDFVPLSSFDLTPLRVLRVDSLPFVSDWNKIPRADDLNRLLSPFYDKPPFWEPEQEYYHEHFSSDDMFYHKIEDLEAQGKEHNQMNCSLLTIPWIRNPSMELLRTPPHVVRSWLLDVTDSHRAPFYHWCWALYCKYGAIYSAIDSPVYRAVFSLNADNAVYFIRVPSIDGIEYTRIRYANVRIVYPNKLPDINFAQGITDVVYDVGVALSNSKTLSESAISATERAKYTFSRIATDVHETADTAQENIARVSHSATQTMAAAHETIVDVHAKIMEQINSILGQFRETCETACFFTKVAKLVGFFSLQCAIYYHSNASRIVKMGLIGASIALHFSSQIADLSAYALDGAKHLFMLLYDLIMPGKEEEMPMAQAFEITESVISAVTAFLTALPLAFGAAKPFAQGYIPLTFISSMLGALTSAGNISRACTNIANLYTQYLAPLMQDLYCWIMGVPNPRHVPSSHVAILENIAAKRQDLIDKLLDPTNYKDKILANEMYLLLCESHKQVTVLSSSRDPHVASLKTYFQGVATWALSELEKFKNQGAWHGHASRPTPFTVFVGGDSGVGKSVFLTSLAKFLFSYEARTFKRDETIPKNLTYLRNPTETFWSGYANQFATIFDDFGALADTVSSPNPNYADLLSIYQEVPVPLNMADLGQKGTTTFNSKVVMASYNHWTPPNSLTNPEALSRRVDVRVTMFYKPTKETQLSFSRQVKGNGEEAFYPNSYCSTNTRYLCMRFRVEQINVLAYKYIKKGACYTAEEFLKLLGQMYVYKIREFDNRKDKEYDIFEQVLLGMSEVTPPVQTPQAPIAVPEAIEVNEPIEKVVKVGEIIPPSSLQGKEEEDDETVLEVEDLKTDVPTYDPWFTDVDRAVDAYLSNCIINPQQFMDIDFETVPLSPPPSESTMKSLYNKVKESLTIGRDGIRNVLLFTAAFGLAFAAYRSFGASTSTQGGAHNYGPERAYKREHIPRVKHTRMDRKYGDVDDLEEFYGGWNQGGDEEKSTSEVKKDDVGKQTMEMMNSMTTNVYGIFIKTRAGTNLRVGNITFLRGVIALMHRHGWVAIERSGSFAIARSAETALTFISVTEVDVYNYTTDGVDAVLLVIPQHHEHRDIVKYFLTPSEAIQHNGYGVLLYGLTEGHSVPTLRMTRDYHISQNAIPYGHKDQGVMYTVGGHVQYKIPTITGDCGSLLCVNSPRTGKLILGLHVCGNGVVGFSVLLNKDILLDLISKIDLKHRIEPIAPVLVDSTRAVDVLVDDVDKNVKAVIEAAPGFSGFTLIGSLNEKLTNYQPSHSRIVPSPFANKLFGKNKRSMGPHRVPAKLSDFKNDKGEWVRPFDNAFMKLSVPPTMIPRLLIQEAGEELYDHIFLRKWENRGVLTLEQAVSGLTDSEIQSIDLSKSAGFFGKEFPREGVGKRPYLGTAQQLNIVAEVRERVDLIIDLARQGKSYKIPFIQTLKDERRDHERVAAGKTRMFSAASLDFLLVFRMYFSQFIAYIQSNRIENGVAVGIDPHSEEWNIIALKLKGDDNTVMAGDFSGFDGSLQRNVLVHLGTMINQWYGKNNPDNDIRTCLWSNITDSWQVAGTVVVAWTHGLPSGNPMTAVLNSLYNLLATRMAWKLVTVAEKVPELRRYFSDYVYMIVYGDDAVISQHPEVKNFWNTETLTKAYATLGMAWTREDKQANTLDLRKIEDVSFLKRGFVYTNTTVHRYIAPLEWEVIEDAVNWCSSSTASREDFNQTISNMLSEASIHSLAKFKELHKALMSANAKTGGLHIVSEKSYETQRAVTLIGDTCA